MVVSVREIFLGAGYLNFWLLFLRQNKEMQKFTVHKASTIYEIGELVGLNILPANFIENLLPPRYKEQHENSDE